MSAKERDCRDLTSRNCSEQDLLDRFATVPGAVRHRSEVLLDYDDPDLPTRCIRAGLLVRVAHGYYATSVVWSALRRREQHIELAHAVSRRHPNVQFSHVTAALLHGLPWLGRVSMQLHSVVDRAAEERSSSIIRRRRIDRDIQPVRVAAALVTSPARTIFDVACDSSFATGLACADYGLARRLTTPDELSSLPLLHSRRKGIRKARTVIDMADGRIESAGESLCRSVIHHLGFIAPVPQYEFWDGGVLLGRGDFYWPEQRVLLEFDGLAKYTNPQFRDGRTAGEVVVEEKLREDRIRRLGIRVVRLTWDELKQPSEVARLLTSAGIPQRQPRGD